jgi:K+-transporting ATPase KdpF subunit
MTVTDELLIALSVAVFIYLGFALFKAERFLWGSHGQSSQWSF